MLRRVFNRIFYVLLDRLKIRHLEDQLFSAHFYRARRLSLILARIVKRIEFRCRLALANGFSVVRRMIFRNGYSS